ncbi:hypothetical protein [Kribbella shirazensis]|uniref:Flagellar basal body-associated protein FliL n=1 Tax=Kribbella shirazensis TaxID=1105143 RepID=A0A7X5V6E2_9ACTN|nr:hypothetical protein [Kribbella shirazensis]NIK55511.1 flagellar basal body-associated protein FliL [Kribbella shirazensis]
MSTRPPYNSAPSYGQPPRKSRAGLIITLIVVLALISLTALGFLAYRIIDHQRTSDPEPGSAVGAASYRPVV